MAQPARQLPQQVGVTRVARADSGTHATDMRSASSVVFALYLTYAAFFFLNIPNRVPGLGVIRPTLLLAIAILGLLFAEGMLFEKKDTSTISKRLNVLLIYMVLSLPFVKWPGSVVTQNLPQFVKAVLFFFVTVKVVDTIPRLRLFLLVVIGSQVLRVYEPLFLHLTTGYWGSSAHMGGGEMLSRLAGAPNDIINPNGLAYVVITAMAFMHYLMTGTKKVWHTLLYLALAPGLLYALLLTGSRSGLVGFGVLALIVFFKSKRKGLLVLVGVVGLAGAISVMTPDQRDRYLSIVSEDTKNASSVTSRSSGVTKDLENGFKRPIFGHGVGTSLEANANYRGQAYYSHVMYTEVFVELGIVGVVLFLLVLWSIVKTSRLAKRTLDERAEVLRQSAPAELAFLSRLANAVQAWVGMGLVFSLAQYGLSEYNWYLVGGLSVVLYNCVVALSDRAAKASKEGAACS
ncbi:MAG: O-antigen ligase family protein [Pseudomonadota bacterium]